MCPGDRRFRRTHIARRFMGRLRKSGTGCTTPRPLIEAMVQVVDPKPRQTVHDPACSTAGFLLAAWEHMKKHPRAAHKAFYTTLKSKFSGIDIVPEVVRLAAMNLYLHGIIGVESIVEAKDALLGRDKVNLDIFWLRDDALDDPDLLPPSEEVAAEIVENLETALERFRGVAAALGER